MEEKNFDACSDDYLNEVVGRTLRLPITIESRCTTAMGRLAQAVRRLARRSRLRRQNSLLDIALRHSQVLVSLVCTAKSNIRLRSEPPKAEISHSILSDSEEAYSLVTYHQKQRLALLELRLSLSGGVLTARADAPRFLWLQASLGQSFSDLRYNLLSSSFLPTKL